MSRRLLSVSAQPEFRVAILACTTWLLESARVRALELVGKELGMFVDRPAVPWSGDFDELSPWQLEKVLDSLLRQADGDDPVAIEAARKQLMIEAGATVIDAEATPVETGRLAC